MKAFVNAIWVMAMLAVITFACDKKGGASAIAGSTSKTWKVVKIKDADGDREKLGRNEQDDHMQFYADGTFTANSAKEHSRGTWTYSEANKALALQFENANVSQNYEVVDISGDKMTLRAGDGSEMILEEEE